MDGEDDGESHCDKTHLDDDYKVSCEFVNPTVDLVDDSLFASKFETSKFENNKEILSYEVMFCGAESASLLNSVVTDEFGEVEIC